jgi:hypothetical protein
MIQRSRRYATWNPLCTITLTAALSVLVASPAKGASELKSAKEIIRRANLASYYAGRDGRAMVRLKIVDGKGRTRQRVFAVLRRNAQGKRRGKDQHYLVLFSRPANVRNTVFLVAKKVGQDDNRWLYLPALDLVRRIAASDKRTSFVGSHMFYEDVSGRHPQEDAHQLLRTSAKHYVIKSQPKDPGSVEFSGYTLWVDKKTFLPLKIEYRDDQGKLYRRVEAARIRTIKGHPTATQMRFTDLRSGGYTLAEMKGIEYDIGIPESVFSERSLRNPPGKWLGRR